MTAFRWTITFVSLLFGRLGYAGARTPSRRRPGRVPSRRRAACGVTTVLIALTVGCAAPAAPTVTPPPASVGTARDTAVPVAISSLPLVDAEGRPTSLAAFRGKIVVLSDVMTLCQETCPLDTANLVATARAVDRAGLGGDVQFVSVTVDPGRDTPARLAAYEALFDPIPANWTLLTGTAANLNTLLAYLGVYHQRVPEGSPPATDWLTHRPLTYDITHTDLVFYFDRAGHDRFVMDGPAHVASGSQLPSRLNTFMDAQGRRNLSDPEADTWTVHQALQVIGWLVGRSLSGTTPR